MRGGNGGEKGGTRWDCPPPSSNVSPTSPLHTPQSPREHNSESCTSKDDALEGAEAPSTSYSNDEGMEGVEEGSSTNHPIGDNSSHHFNHCGDSQPSTSHADQNYGTTSLMRNMPKKLLKPKLELMEGSFDGMGDGTITPTPSLASSSLKDEPKDGCASAIGDYERDDNDAKRYRMSFKIPGKAANRLKRILNLQPLTLKRLGISAVRVDDDRMVSTTELLRQRAKEEAKKMETAGTSRQTIERNNMNNEGVALRVPPSHSAVAPGPPIPSGYAPPPQVPILPHSIVMSSGQEVPPQVMPSTPHSAVPSHIQQRTPTNSNSPLLVNLLSSSNQPPQSGRPYSPYTQSGGVNTSQVGYGPPQGPSLGPTPQPIDAQMAAYHQQQMERQRIYLQQQQQQQQQAVQPTGPPMTPGGSQMPPCTPNTPSGHPQPPGYYGTPGGQNMRPVYSGGQVGAPIYAGTGPPSVQERMAYGAQQAMYSRASMQQETTTAPTPKKRKKPTKKQQQKEAEAVQQHNEAAAAFYGEGRLVHSQPTMQQSGGMMQNVSPPHAYLAPSYAQSNPNGPHQSHAYFQQQQQIAWQQMHQQRMMASQQSGYVPSGPSGGPPQAWTQGQSRPPPVPYPQGQNEGPSANVCRGVSAEYSQDSDNCAVTSFTQHEPLIQQGVDPSPIYMRETGSTPTMFPYPSTSQRTPSSGGHPSTGQQDIGKLIEDEGIDDLGDLDDITPMSIMADPMLSDVAMHHSSSGDGSQHGTYEGERGNGRMDLLETSINSVVDMVAKGGGALSVTPPGSVATPTSSIAPPTPSIQSSIPCQSRRKNTNGGGHTVATAVQRMQQSYVSHAPPSPSSLSYEHNLRASVFHGGGSRGSGMRSGENGRDSTTLNGHDMSNGGRRTDEDMEANIAAIIDRVKAVEAQELKAKEQKAAQGGKTRGGGGGGGRKNKRNTHITKESSPKEDDKIHYNLMTMDSSLRPSPQLSHMTAGQVAANRARQSSTGIVPSPHNAFYHQITQQALPIRPQQSQQPKQ